MIATPLLVLLVACGGATGSGGSTSTTSSTSTSTSSTSTSSASTSSAAAAPTPTTDPTGLDLTCLTSQARVPGARPITYAGPAGARLAGAVVGSGPDAAVFVHQLDDGFCGFWPYLSTLPRPGFTAYLVNLCGYAGSRCELGSPFYGDRRGQLRLVVEEARRRGARRVTLVGASMGGSMVVGFARSLGADAVVDLSGPGQWYEAPPAAQVAPTLTMPVLAALSAQDSGDRAAVEAMVQAAPSPHKDFVWLEAGHGWELLTDHADARDTVTPLGERVARWIRGDYR
ncbi:hypothetical protein ADJ73_00630 [Arsenicicoccus sp. oral taxon 190]|nr:hypothetical protein ADJ73_00630 [Arsenicicoccus sp. oral taxon 190]